MTGGFERIQLNREPLASEVVRQLIDGVLANRIGAGERLPSERKLSEMLGVGRSVVREALKSLTVLGLSRSGARVDEQTPVADFLFQRGFAPEDATPSDFWQLHNTYVLAQVATGYVIVDQHAAHERVLFEEIMKGKQAAAPQGLLFPISVDLGPEEFATFERFGGQLPQPCAERQWIPSPA